jgi:hypothetical protein
MTAAVGDLAGSPNSLLDIPRRVRFRSGEYQRETFHHSNMALSAEDVTTAFVRSSGPFETWH